MATLSFGGIRGVHNTFLVDGSDYNNAFFAQARGRYRAPYQFSTEVVQEFRVARFWGSNNVFLDPASPVTYDSISNNGEEHVSTETANLSLTSSITLRSHQPSPRTVLPRSAAVL